MKLLYFAKVRETLNCSQEEFDLPKNVSTIAGLKEFLAQRGDKWAEVFLAMPNLKVAVDQVLIREGNVSIKTAKEIAFFPPMTGG